VPGSATLAAVADTPSEGGARELLGLTGLVGQPLRRVLVRRRESPVTTSAWRLDVTCDQGEGGIVRVEGAGDQLFHRGDGVFLGWSQEHLAQLYDELTRPAPGGEPDLELLQLG
jgi:hypothetical protein